MKRLKQNRHIFILLFVAALMLASCVTVQQTNTTVPSPAYKYNFSSLYNPGESLLHPESRVYINSDTSAIVFYKISKQELRQSITDPTSQVAKLQIKYVLRDLTSFEIIDSSSFFVSVNLKEINSDLDSYFKIKIPTKGEYKIIVSISGQRENSGKRLIVEIDKTSLFTKDFFLPESLGSGSWSVLYNNYVNSDSAYRLSSTIHKAANLNFEYYRFLDYTLVPPYYMPKVNSELRKPDSIFIYKTGDTLRFESEGVYIMKPSSQNSSTMRFVNAGKYFPQVKVLGDMAEPLKIITGNREYNELIGSEDLKSAIDNFWLSKSNNQKIAKEQIRVFYNRVSLANQYFTEEKEGWKTDRGIIYVMLGPPSIINMSAAGEEWFYGENPDIAGILFVFDKIKISETGSHFVLRRNEIYQSTWGQALTTWKNGRIFTITNN